MTQTKTNPQFVSTLNKGFQMTFENGLTISVQWGDINYCSNRVLETGYISENSSSKVKSEDAEIAIWDSNERWYCFGNDTVKGWCSPDLVAKIISEVQKASRLIDLDLSKFSES